MTERRSRPPRARSDRPPPISLHKERDDFIQTFLKRGAQLTEELIRENDRMRQQLAELETENVTLRAQLKSDDAIREALDKIASLEREKNELVSRFREVAARSDEYAMTFAEVENELSNLASLYVASNQLHATLNLRGVLRHIKEILAQLVGTKSFAIYFVSDDGTALVPIAHEGTGAAALSRVPVGAGPIGTCFATGTSEIAEEGDIASRTVEQPAACVPLRVEDRIVGVIALFATLEQKAKFLPVDYELFKLLAAHAASAVVAAVLFAQSAGRLPGTDAFLDAGA
jgi:putative methionine-R-sulfoxide reductase with GAF domain